MTNKLIIIIVLAALFCFFEFAQHRDFNEKHPDQEHCPSMYGGFLLIALVSILYLFT